MTENAFARVAGTGRLLFLCDHAANALPPEMNKDGLDHLGLTPGLFQTHIAYDIGAADATRALAAAYGAPAILGVWSRLLIDLNRGADDPTIVMKLSDGAIIPGNGRAGTDEVARRIAAFHAPYHAAIAAELDRIGPAAVIVSMHSFTPSWKKVPRKWEVGVLYDTDTRLAAPLMRRLAEAGLVVGDNEPYSGALDGDTLNVHGTRRGLPHVLIEMRKDLIATPAMAQDFAGKLKPVLDLALGDMKNAQE
jgi:predicted N-formylglutamate amidohydrolase